MKILSILLAVLLVAGCGVRASGTIPGGPAPNVSAVGIALFFVSNGKVSLVLRPGPEPPLPEILNTLGAGPNAFERAAGFSTAIPAKAAPITVMMDESSVDVHISMAPSALSELAVEQLACTALANQPTVAPGGEVRLAGDGQRIDISCPQISLR
ncbi:hypothetical protein [Fodinicola acaciae]|uniref:hypothetical protein n=1 Tax=Fodinicola acaciae TaxID=2681555 RepID=UPI0013D8535A|nr:hypothetical protein [Fodinicola acaciae]